MMQNENTTKYGNAANSTEHSGKQQKFPGDIKSDDLTQTHTGHVICCHGLWLMKLLNLIINRWCFLMFWLYDSDIISDICC